MTDSTGSPGVPDEQPIEPRPRLDPERRAPQPVPPPWQSAPQPVPPQLPQAAPPARADCPSCHHSRRHHRGCELESLSVELASLLGYTAARDRVPAMDDGEDRSPSRPVPGGVRGWLHRLLRR